ncbi:MAG: transketolase [Geoalkalibacter sp.]|uniref:transketolase n=1 Tax=Geoalkalibacter sp. TaxID=3041440 RepID=UPI003D0B2C8C
MKTREETISELREFAYSMRKSALETALEAGKLSTHFGGGLSIIDITATLYGAVMKLDPTNPTWEERDRFILSKGHGVVGYYTALVERGFIAKEELKTFERTGSALLGHPVMNRSKGIEFTNGSLGMGLSLGIGVALAGKAAQKDYKVYVLMGDGECNEGSVWEAAMSAPQFRLDNLVAIIDRNNFQLGGRNEEVLDLLDLRAKWDSFGWDAIEVDGHDHGQLYDVFTQPVSSGKPRCIVANTVKGKGVSFAENNNDWHHAVLTQNQYDQAILDIEQLRGEH